MFKLACGFTAYQISHLSPPSMFYVEGTFIMQTNETLPCSQNSSLLPPHSLSRPHVKLANQSQRYIFPFGLYSPSSLYRPWWPHTFPQPPPHLAGQPAASHFLLTWSAWLPLGCDARDSEDSWGRKRVQRRRCVNNGHPVACSPLSATNTARAFVFSF